jgi:hypothetical protein
VNGKKNVFLKHPSDGFWNDEKIDKYSINIVDSSKRNLDLEKLLKSIQCGKSSIMMQLTELELLLIEWNLVMIHDYHLTVRRWSNESLNVLTVIKPIEVSNALRRLLCMFGVVYRLR